MMTRSPQDGRALRALLEISILVGALTFLFVSLAARAGDNGMGTVAGTVMNASGAPVPAARVTLCFTSGSNPRQPAAPTKYLQIELVRRPGLQRSLHSGAKPRPAL